ncbi:CDP-glycerol glycerophosphotransferase family protein [Treponema primitia]|uniref:CDP-glycerol glycerophosphotransferase family protein n=1 Tax=Treponema primitia TaxID=88058 RepID=UPI001E289D86|nr:CDP-glycerol glycerophosphotransferase family protein [Treponema primitia]
MLFSLLTGLAVTVFFFFKNVLIKIKTGSLFNKNSKRNSETASAARPQLVIYSEGKQYWNVFKPVLEELIIRGMPCVYYTSGEDDPGLSFQAPDSLLEKKFIGKGNAAYNFLNFLEADVCLMTTPGLDVLQLKRSPGVRHYAHILHMVTDATTYRLFSLDYYNSVFLTGEYQKKDIRQLEEQRGTARKELFVTGCTYLDVMAEHIKELPKEGDHKKTVLVAPSWGANGIMRRYGLRLLDPLAKSSYRIIIRPHPQSMISEKNTIETLQKSLDSYKNVEWNFDVENLTALSRADVLISDFSGVVFDYVFLFDRPVIYPRFDFDKRPYDLADIEDEAWTFRAIRNLGTAVNEDDFEKIEGFLDRIIGGGEKKEISGKLRNEAYMYPGEAGKRVVDALCSILQYPQGISDAN